MGLGDAKVLYLEDAYAKACAEVVPHVYAQTCRVDFTRPGFCCIQIAAPASSIAFRQTLCTLADAVAKHHQLLTGKTIFYTAAGRFDQQENTRPHVDGGPEQSVLILGYEPSEVLSEISIYDYAKCAYELGITPKQFLTDYNPMFQSGYERLQPYRKDLPRFLPTSHYIVFINNSSAPYAPEARDWQGVLHTAKMVTPDADKTRFVNSVLLGYVPSGHQSAVSRHELDKFIQG